MIEKRETGKGKSPREIQIDKEIDRQREGGWGWWHSNNQIMSFYGIID